MLNIYIQVVEGREDDDDNIAVLQKKIRELNFALEQCERGAAIPTIHIPTPEVLQEASKLTTSNIVRNYLDKYNPSQVDQFLAEINLTEAMGLTEAKKEEFSNEVNKIAKLWPAEINRQTRLIDSPFPGTVEKEVNFWSVIISISL